MGRIGLLYIGQAPKEDYVAFFKAGLPGGTEIVQAGALDDLSVPEIEALPRREGDPILVMQTRDLVTVTATKLEVQRRLQGKIEQLESLGAQVIVVLCTGKFSGLRAGVLLLEPSEILVNNALSVSRGRRVAVITPLPEQIPQTAATWRSAGIDPIFDAASPYGPVGVVEKAALRVNKREPDLIVLDCMGYTEAMKQAVARVTGKPSMAARTIVRRVLAELV